MLYETVASSYLQVISSPAGILLQEAARSHDEQAAAEARQRAEDQQQQEAAARQALEAAAAWEAEEREREAAARAEANRSAALHLTTQHAQELVEAAREVSLQVHLFLPGGTSRHHASVHSINNVTMCLITACVQFCMCSA